MRFHCWIGAVATAAITFGAASAADAQTPPTTLADRPLTLPEGNLRVDTSFDILRARFTDGMGNSASDTFAVWRTGAGFGIMDDLEAGALILPLILTPDFQYGDIQLYGMYRFLEGDVEVAGRLELNIPTNTDFGLTFGLPVLARLGDSLRLDTGVVLNLFLANDTVVGLSELTGQFAILPQPIATRSIAGVPLLLNYNVTESFTLGGGTGFGVVDFGNFGDTVFFPLGIQGGYALPVSDLLVDLGARFEFPFFLTPGGNDVVNVDLWRIIFGAEIYFDVF